MVGALFPAGKSDHIEFDEVTPGFGVRLRESGRRKWPHLRLAIGDMRWSNAAPARRI
jgi:hypothetical protein